MTKTLPLIGISVGSGKLTDTNGASLRVRSTYPVSVELAGGAPVMIPLRVDLDVLRSIYDRLDGVLITGGGDIDPVRYGAQTSVFTTEVDANRDEIELQLTRWAIEDDKPLFGICRGQQVFNVALGGTLIQDIREEVPGSLRHDSPSDEWFTRMAHDVRVTRGSRLYDALGLSDEHLPVNSMHHQSAAEVAEPLRAVAVAPDGVIEGLEHPDRYFAVSVQWHPEALADHDTQQRLLFETFIKAASSR